MPASIAQSNEVPLAAENATHESVSALGYEIGLAGALWRRELWHLWKEKSRWVGVVAQPLIFWAIAASGMSEVFNLPGHDDVDFARWSFPGIIVMTILFTAIFATISLVEDRQTGFLTAALVAPGSRAALVAGKIGGVLTMVLLQVLLLVPFVPLAGVPWREVAWAALFAAVVLSGVGLAAIGFCMAWLLPSTQAYHGVMSIVLLPMWVLSGAVFPIPHGWLGWIMTANPMTYAVAATRLSFDPAHATSANAAGDFGALAVFAAAMTTLAVFVSRRGTGAAR